VLMVHRDNQRAIEFYDQCGFEWIPNVVRNDHLLMKLWIGD
jgi:ribosomal protein S18 acetylase RimI-like enzyme